MYTSLKSISLHGMQPEIVNVEVTLCRGLPQFTIIGLPDKTIQESRDRVISALEQCGFRLPLMKIIVNLAPADMKKDGGKFDLAIAIGILIACGKIHSKIEKDTVVLGEISLSGKVRRIRGVLAMLLGGKNNRISRFIIPEENLAEIPDILDTRIAPAEDLHQAIAIVSGVQPFKHTSELSGLQPSLYQPSRFSSELMHIKNQDFAIRAAIVAAAGRHHILLYGPPGVGKTMLAKQIPMLLPAMSPREKLETTSIYSLFGWKEKGEKFIHERPFRSPHHSSSDISIVGGGSFPKPGEISLAHNGVLFLDEFQEFKVSILNMLRQPLQEKKVVLSRASGSVTYPSNFLLICAMNSCPCGNFMDKERRCICTPHAIKKYFSRISGPLLDRIDIQVEMPRLCSKANETALNQSSSAAYLQSIHTAAQMQKTRFKNLEYSFNSEIPVESLSKLTCLDRRGQEAMEIYINKNSPSHRALSSILKVARTIADLDESDVIQEKHLLESMMYRQLESKIYRNDGIP